MCQSSLAQFQSRICSRLVVVFTKTALEMLQNLQLTLYAIFLVFSLKIIKPFLWYHPWCHSLRVYPFFTMINFLQFLYPQNISSVLMPNSQNFTVNVSLKNLTYKFFWNSWNHLRSRSRCHLQYPLQAENK